MISFSPMSARTPEEAASKVRPERVLELDGLRAFAILPVILHHCYPFDGLFGLSDFLGGAGFLGVDLFFVLSGYLITGILLNTVKRPHYYRNFIVRRTLRIFPLYYVCLALFTISVWLFGGPLWAAMREWGNGWFVVYLGNVRAAWLNAYPPAFVFFPLWSLQVEEQFYLLYPLVVLLLSQQNLRRLLIGCAVTAPLLRLYLLLFVADSSVARFVLMPCRMDALALGGLVSILARSPSALWPSRMQVRCGAVIMGAAALGVYSLSRHSEHSNTILHPLMSSVGYSLNALAFAFLLAMIVLWPSTSLAALLRWRPFVYTGEIAYGLYLLHVPAAWIARKLLMKVLGIDVPGHSALSVPITFLAGFLAARVSWRFLESPILTLKDRFTLPTRGFAPTSVDQRAG